MLKAIPEIDLFLLVMPPNAMDCQGLAQEWYKCIDVRTRILESKSLLEYTPGETWCKPNRENSVRNAMVLGPVLKRLATTPKHHLPHLDDLQVEVTTLFEKTGLSTKEKAPYKASVEVKRLAGFIKRRCNRKEVTKECIFSNVLQRVELWQRNIMGNNLGNPQINQITWNNFR